MRGFSLFSKLAVEVVTAPQKEWAHELLLWRAESNITCICYVCICKASHWAAVLNNVRWFSSGKAFGHLKQLVCPRRHFLQCCAAKCRAESDLLPRKQSVMMPPRKFLVPSLAPKIVVHKMEKCQNPTEIQSKKKTKQKHSSSFVCGDEELCQKMWIVTTSSNSPYVALFTFSCSHNTDNTFKKSKTKETLFNQESLIEIKM